MEQVKNKVFYHIGNFDSGQTYKIGEQLNPFFDYFNHFGYPEPIEWPQIKQLLNDYQLYIRERIFEDIRLEKFPEYPSRMTCLWILPPDHLTERITFWKKQITHPNKKICKLSCTGIIHIGDEAFLSSRFGYLPSYREDAIQYWSGKFKSSSSIHQEVIFKGIISVIATYVDMSEIPNDEILTNPFQIT